MTINPIFTIVILIMSVVIHEVSHGYAAERLGDPTAKLQGRLTLNPLKHLDMWGSVIIPLFFLLTPGNFIFGWAKPVPYNPYNLKNKRGWPTQSLEAIVAAAGPLSNIFLALVFGLLIRFGVLAGDLLTPAAVIVFINLVLALFNLIPIPPLDGSKILFSVLPLKYHNFRVKLEQMGFILVLFFVFFLWQLLVPVIFFFFTMITGVSF